MKWEYCIVLVATLFFPLVLSRDKNLPLRKNPGVVLRTILFVSIPFWIWDIAATERGHWSFNPLYVTGVSFLGMPIEEWFFFIVVVFVSVFVWESVKYFMRGKT